MNAADLIKKWDARDNRYSTRRVLTDAEIDSIKTFRRSETQDLHPDEQEIALRWISIWHPPIVTIR